MAFVLTGIGAFVVSNSMKSSVGEEEQLDYVNQTIIEPNDDEIEVVNQEVSMIKPYTDEKVQIAKYYYDYQGDSETQENQFYIMRILIFKTQEWTLLLILLLMW